MIFALSKSEFENTYVLTDLAETISTGVYLHSDEVFKFSVQRAYISTTHHTFRFRRTCFIAQPSLLKVLVHRYEKLFL